METLIRPSWDDYFMSLARVVATRATCNRLYAGAVLVKDHRIVSTGYNGAPPALGHCDEDGHLLEDGHCVRTIHAEHNALLQAAIIGGASTKGATLYTLYSPCIHCAKYVAAAGIKRIVIGKMYRNEGVLEYLRNAEVDVSLYVAAEKLNGQLSELFLHDIDEKKEKPVILESGK